MLQEEQLAHLFDELRNLVVRHQRFARAVPRVEQNLRHASFVHFSDRVSESGRRRSATECATLETDA